MADAYYECRFCGKTFATAGDERMHESQCALGPEDEEYDEGSEALFNGADPLFI